MDIELGMITQPTVQWKQNDIVTMYDIGEIRNTEVMHMAHFNVRSF